MHETFAGVCNGLNIAPGEMADLEANFRSVHCARYTGGTFADFVAQLCRTVRPDIVWIDPLLSYIGGEISKMQDTSRFLQNQLQPVIEDANVGLVVVHHTGKPPKSDDAKYKGRDLAYLGIGSSVLTNWARATSTLLQTEEDENRFRLEHGKRGDRAGCPKSADIMHAPFPEICWLAAPAVGGRPRPSPSEMKRPRASRYDGIGLETMPPVSGIWHDEERTSSAAAIAVASLLAGAGMGTSIKAAARLLASRRLMDFLTYDKATMMWQGRLYDPSFG
jgi:hypothetical protein